MRKTKIFAVDIINLTAKKLEKQINDFLTSLPNDQYYIETTANYIIIDYYIYENDKTTKKV